MASVAIGCGGEHVVRQMDAVRTAIGTEARIRSETMTAVATSFEVECPVDVFVGTKHLVHVERTGMADIASQAANAVTLGRIAVADIATSGRRRAGCRP